MVEPKSTITKPPVKRIDYNVKRVMDHIAHLKRALIARKEQFNFTVLANEIEEVK